MDTPSFDLGLSQSQAPDCNIVTMPPKDRPTEPENGVLEAPLQSLVLSNTSNACKSSSVDRNKSKNKQLDKNKGKYKQLDKENMAIAIVEKKSTARKNKEYSTRYYEWRAEFGAELGITTKKRIEDFNMQEIVDFSRHLVFFMQQIQKSNGQPYALNTMRDHLHTFGRILKKGQYEPEIKVTSDALFKASRDAFDKVINDNARVNGVSYEDEFLLHDGMILQILESEFLSTSSPNGLLRHVEFYCITCFFIRPGAKLWETLCIDFNFKKDVHGSFIRFCQQPSKNRPLNMKNCKPCDRRRPVEVYSHINPDLYETFRLYFCHMPPPDDDEDFMERHLLLAVITKPRSSVWYQIQNLGIHKIGSLAKVVSSILGVKVTNMTFRHFVVTREREQGCPDDTLVNLTGHKRSSTLKNYDHSGKLEMMAMQASLMPGENHCYNQILDETKKKAREDLRPTNSAEAEVVEGSVHVTSNVQSNLHTESSIPVVASSIPAAASIIHVTSSPQPATPAAASIIPVTSSPQPAGLISASNRQSSTMMNFFHCNFPTASCR